MIYVEGDVTSIKGQLSSRITVVASGSIRVTGNLQYVDDDWDTAYRNGTDPDEPYESNPEYGGEAVLGLIANEDILYSKYVPDHFEINGSLLAKTGRVGIEGVRLDDEGNVSLSWPRYVKSSIRRLGGVISNERPVTTYIDDHYDVRAGFRTGNSVYDRRLSVQPPVGFPERQRPRTMAIVSREVVN
jgi:hypothetical protein